MMPGEKTACSSCQKQLALADVLYTEDAQPVCSECSGKREILGDEKRAARNIRYAAQTCLGAAIFGFAAFCIGIGLFFYFFAFTSVAAGLYAGQAVMFAPEDRFTKHISLGERMWIIICTVAGLMIAGFETLVILGVIHWIPPWLRHM